MPWFCMLPMPDARNISPLPAGITTLTWPGFGERGSYFQDVLVRDVMFERLLNVIRPNHRIISWRKETSPFSREKGDRRRATSRKGSISAATTTEVTGNGFLVVSRTIHVDKAVAMLVLEVRHPDLSVDHAGEGAVLIAG